MNKIHAGRSALLLALMTMSALVAGQPSVPDGRPQALPDLGAIAPLPTSSAPLPDDMRPRKRLVLKPRMKPEELKPETRPEFKPEMGPGMQPNSQKPLHTDAPTRRAY